MSLFYRVFESRSAARLVLAGLTSALLAGCSSDFTRLGDASGGPFQNSSRYDQTPTATTLPPMTGAPVARVQSAPLGSSIQSSSLAPPTNPAYSVPARPSPRLAAAPEVRGSANGWSADGGAQVVMAQGETVSTLSKRYGVPADAILKANGYSSASQVQPGTRLTVPTYDASGAAASRVASGAPVRSIPSRVAARAPEPRAVAKPHVEEARRKVEPVRHVAAKAVETKQKVAAIRPPTRPSKAELAHTTKIERQEKAKAEAEAKLAEIKENARTETKPVRTASLHPQTKTDATPTASLPKATAPAEAASPEFRWPARGRIIQGFKSGSSDGINIAVPEGTSVKAAEGGVVAYAGNELKGYGNLVLIRHPNGFVSAYAHNGELSVKRGETVKRGQTIAKSGQTGNVASPQLHFELRKGSTPVDPTQYLAGL